MENTVAGDMSRSAGNNSRDLTLDFLKSVSMVLVVFFHNIQLNPDSIADNIFMMWGNAAVPSFFICFMMRFLTLSQPFIFVHAQGVDAVSFENEWLW